MKLSKILHRGNGCAHTRSLNVPFLFTAPAVNWGWNLGTAPFPWEERVEILLWNHQVWWFHSVVNLCVPGSEPQKLLNHLSSGESKFMEFWATWAGGRWIWMTFKVHSNPRHSRIAPESTVSLSVRLNFHSVVALETTCVSQGLKLRNY